MVWRGSVSGIIVLVKKPLLVGSQQFGLTDRAHVGPLIPKEEQCPRAPGQQQFIPRPWKHHGSTRDQGKWHHRRFVRNHFAPRRSSFSFTTL